MTPEQRRESAAIAIRHFASTIELDDVFVHTDLTGDADDVRAIAMYIRTATVEITWPDETPPRPGPHSTLDGIRGTNGLIYADGPDHGEPIELTAAQEIRLRAFESLTDQFIESDKIREVLAMVVQAGRVIETGELDDEEPVPGWSSAEALKEAYTAMAERFEVYAERLTRIRHILDAVGDSLPASDRDQLRAALEWEPDPGPHGDAYFDDSQALYVTRLKERGEHGQPKWSMDRPAVIRVTEEAPCRGDDNDCDRPGTRYRCGTCLRTFCSMHVGRNEAGDHPGGMACVPPQPAESEPEPPAADAGGNGHPEDCDHAWHYTPWTDGEPVPTDLCPACGDGPREVPA